MSYAIHMKGRDDPRTLFQIDRLHAWKHGEYFPPATVEISPTNACNQKCKYCYAWRSKDREYLRDDLLVGCVDQLADAGVGAVVFQGTGEPLLHKSLPQAIERGATRKLPVQLTTNGVLLNAACQDAILPHLFCLRISVIDNDGARYACQHGCGEQQWRTLVANVERAVSIRSRDNLPFAIWATVYLSEDNWDDLYETVRFCKNLGIDFVYVTEPQYTSFSPSGKSAYTSVRLAERGCDLDAECARIRSLIDEDFFLKIKFHALESVLSGPDCSTWRAGYCQGIKFYTLIGCDGGVYPCWRCWEEKTFSYGSLYNQRFEDIWRGRQREKVETMVLETPPGGDECFVCTVCLLNKVLDQVAHPTLWREFL